MRVALCIPSQGDVRAAFTLSLAAMIAKSVREDTRLDLVPLMAQSSILPESRNRLVEAALTAGADYLLLMDSDHSFPADTLLRLLRHKLACVGANYARRDSPTGPTARRFDRNGNSIPVYTTEQAAAGNALEEVAQIGMGLCLVEARVFRRVPEPWFDFERLGKQLVGEDTYFCRKLREARIPIYVDHGLSWETGHVHSHLLTHRDVLREGPKRERPAAKDTAAKSRLA